MVVMLIGILFSFLEGMTQRYSWSRSGSYQVWVGHECQGSCLLCYPSWKQIYM